MTVSGQGPVEPPGVSIVIAVLNQVDYTRRCLDSLRANTDIPHEIIIIDNGSSDGSDGVCAAAGCRVIRNEENVGCARAWNQGIRAARFPLIVIMNNDIIVPPGWLRALVEFWQRAGFDLISPAVINGPVCENLPDLAVEYCRYFAGRRRAVVRRVEEAHGRELRAEGLAGRRPAVRRPDRRVRR